VNSTKDIRSIDRRAVAEQVIVSAGNILVAAGFAREEIGDFFRQAADQLQGGACAVEGNRPAEGEQWDDGLAPIAAAFSENSAVQELHGLAVQAQTLLPLDRDSPGLRDAFDMAMRMVPLLAEAQHVLRTLASEASLPLFANREEWRKRVGAGELAEAAPAVCLEDFETTYRGAFEMIGAIAEELLKRQDQEAFTFLLAHLADNGVVVSAELQASIEKVARSIGA